MKEKSVFTKKNMENLSKIINQPSGIDFRKIDLRNQDVSYRLNDKISLKITPDFLELLKAYQRLLRILPEKYKEYAIALLKSEIHSAIQISSMPINEFIKICVEKCKMTTEIAELVYRGAQAKTSEIVVQYMKSYQNNEPHIKSARFK